MTSSRHAEADGSSLATQAGEAEETPDRLAALGRRPLVSVAGTTYVWDDALAWAAAEGSLAELEQSARQGLASARRAAADDESPDPAAVAEAAKSFRYARRLLAAEDLEAWLERWQLTVGEWSDHLERTLLPAGDGASDPIDVAPSEAELAGALYVDAVCSGFLERAAVGFATDLALAEPAGEGAESPGREAMIAHTIAAAAAAREQAKSPEGVEREFSRHALDWTRLEMEVLEVGDANVAREAALCVRIDGRALAEVAADCGAELRPSTSYLADLEPTLRATLLSAQPGELVGPLQDGERFALCAIRARTPASPNDEELRRRAEQALVERAAKRASETHLEWHERL